MPIVSGLNITDDDDITSSIALGDVDRDGDLDVVVGNFPRFPRFDENSTKEGGANRLYLNNGTENPFENVNGTNISNDTDDTDAIALGDVDADGDLDVVVGNSLGQPNRLYLNNGTENPFENVNGINISEDRNCTLSLALGDVDGDNDLDVVFGNFGVNRLYLNNGTANPFADINGLNITDDDGLTRSIALGDVDGDGDLDVVAGNDRASNRLYLNNDTANPFENVNGFNISEDSNITESLALGDVDGDGDLDVVAGGFGANRLYLNTGSANPFAGGIEGTITRFPESTKAIAIEDVNGDGSLEVVTGNESGPNYVYFLFSPLHDPTKSEYQTHLGTVVSRVLNDRTEPILSATLKAMVDLPLQTDIDFYLSNNDGQNWYQVKVGAPFVFPTTGSDLRWRAELHSLSPAITPVLKSVSITANSAPTDIILSDTSIEENSEITSEIGTFEVLDIDDGTHSYSLIEGFGSDDNSAFSIVENKLLANAIFDFETKRSYTIRVQATDEGGGEFEKQFTIGVSDGNDPPTEIMLTNNEVKENLQTGATIGVLSVSDIDFEDLHVFSLPEGVADNDLFAIDGTELKSNAKFDFEIRDNYKVRIRVTDGGGASIAKDFTIAVTDVIDSVDIELQLSLMENLTYGEKLSVTANITAAVSGALNAETIFQFSGPNDFKENLSVFSSEGGVASESYAPPFAGNWELAANWAGNSDFNPKQSEPLMFRVEKSDTILELFFLGVTQILGQDRSIPGRLVLNNGNPGGLDLSGLEISVTITNGTKAQDFIAITDAKGNFDLEIPSDFFDEEGAWEVTASFTGNDNLNASNIGDEGEILVRQTHGYAILVQGSIANGEGADEHGNTLDFVRRSFETAGFSTSIDDPDIKIISRNTPDPESALREAIEDWAKEKMLAAPAPLYLLLINHGEFGTFHMHPDELTPEELDGMLNNLQGELAGVENNLAREQAIITILGMCFSGSFIGEISGNIPELPGNNRIIVSAAAPDEFSIRGTGQDDERQGELFVYTLFRELNKGLSLTESFQNSRTTVRRLSADRNLAINVNAVDPFFPGEKGQHPLLDDNGDGVGSSLVLATSGDGDLASTVFLTQPTNAIPALQIDRVGRTVFLALGQEIPRRLLWAEIDEDPKEIRRIWMEVKKVAEDTGVDETSTMQHDLDLFEEPMDFYSNGDFVGYEWPRDVADPNPNGLFLDPGAYQVFVYAESTEERVEISDPRVAFVYRASGNHTPSQFGLLAPVDKALLDYNPETPPTFGVFTWEASQSTGGEVKYIYRVWAESEQKTLVFESEPLISTHIFLPPEIVDNRTYWWDVVAVDEEGNFTNSRELFQFTVDKPNNVPGRVLGRLFDKESGAPISIGEVVISGLEPVIPVDEAGSYLISVSPASYSLTARSPGYLDVTIDEVDVESSRSVILNFELTKVGIELNPGSNLISVPVNLADPSVATLFAGNPDLASSLKGMVWQWDGVGYQSTSQLHPGFGYWVESPVAEFIETGGTIPDPLTAAYEKGWQLVGVKGEKVFQLSEDMALPGQVWGWDSENQNYYSIGDSTLSLELRNKLIPGRGYWMYFGETTTLEFE